MDEVHPTHAAKMMVSLTTSLTTSGFTSEDFGKMLSSRLPVCGRSCATATTFPVGPNVDTILPNGTPKILHAIGLSPKSPPAGATIDGNVDADHDGKNETHVALDPHKAEVIIAALVVRDTPTSSGKNLGIIANR